MNNDVELQPYQEETELSVVRLLLLLAVFGGMVFLLARWSINQIAEARAEPGVTWFAPYVDVTLTPTLHFEEVSEQPSSDIVLGFIVSSPANGCEPSWGTYYDLEAAARALDLDRRIVQLRERGGDIVVSFGGAINNELATTCTDVEKLTYAYQSVIDRYQLTALDFDIEGAALGDGAANARRAQAIKNLQAANEGLDVWFTLPVDPDGLRAEAVTLLDNVLATGVDLTGVNAMTMNYAGSRPGTMSMKDATVRSLTSTWQQLDGIYRRNNLPLTEKEIWNRIGITPMIGQNDVPADVFTLETAEAVLKFAKDVNAGRLSFWSANRDMPCGANVDDTRVSNTCSGVAQEPLEFGRMFANAAPSRRSEILDLPPSNELPSGGIVRDDPLTSPYPLWREAKAYTEGAKVTWQGRVYQAKWWSQGDQPDAPVKNTWETPWRYLGPVLASDREALANERKTVTGNRPRWIAERVYVAGDEIEYNGMAFRAKWWTQGDEPQEDPDQPYDHPWLFLGEIVKSTPAPGSGSAATPAASSTPSPTATASATTTPSVTPSATPEVTATATSPAPAATTISQSYTPPATQPEVEPEDEEPFIPAPSPTVPPPTPEPTVASAPPPTQLPTATPTQEPPAPTATPAPARTPNAAGPILR